MSDQSLMKNIGKYIKQHRLDQNKSQDQVANEAGISRSTLSLLEKGDAGTVTSLIQVLRVLNLLNVMDAFQLSNQISPLELAKLEQEKRKKASASRSTPQPKSEW
ncbi:MAG: helix-turn-helix transcriptional regulator [Bacteroidota bacterium]